MFPLHRDEHKCVAVPLQAHLKLAAALNAGQVKSRQEFKEICNRCDALLGEDRAEHIMSISDDFDQDNGPPNSRKTSEAENDDVSPAGNLPEEIKTLSVNDEEIEQLYDYIRGYGPPPRTASGKKKRESGGTKPKPPTPPPIETMPTSGSSRSGGAGGDDSRLRTPVPPPHSSARKESDSKESATRLNRPASKSSEDLKQRIERNAYPGYPPYPQPRQRQPGPPPGVVRRPVSMVVPDNVPFSPQFYGPTTVFVSSPYPVPPQRIAQPPDHCMFEPPPPYTSYGPPTGAPPPAIVRRFVPRYVQPRK